MSTSDHSKEIAVLAKKLRAEFGPPASLAVSAPEPAPIAEPTAQPAAAPHSPAHILLEPDQPILNEFVRSMLIWESTTAKAAAVLKRIADAVVDLNDFRVCLPNDMVKILGERYPRVEERCLRLRAALNQLFIREHALTMQLLAAIGKREAREYLDTLEGVPRFVSARVCLLCLGGHTAPVDGRVLKRLIEAEIVEPGATTETAAGILERGVKAGELADVYRLLQASADQASANYSETPAPAAVESTRSHKDARSSPNHAHHADSGKKKPAGSKGGGAGKEPSKK